jgi:hypothetical protein
MPDDIVPVSSTAGESELQSDLDILNADEPESKEVETEESPEVEESTESSTDEEFSEEEQEETEEPEPEKEESLEGLDARGKELVGKITKLAPDLLKKVPELRGVIFRDHEYGKLFPTVEDAKEAAGKLGVMDQFEASLMQGQSRLVLSTLAQTDPGAYAKFAESFLPTLFQGDRRTYVKVTLPLVKNILRSAIVDGSKIGGEFGKNLTNAGKVISKHLFDSYEVPEDAKPSQNQEQTKFEQERRNFYAARYQEFDSSTKLAAIEKFRTDVESSLKDVKLSKFVKDALITAVIKETNETLGKDKAHQALMNSLWARAKKSGLSEATKSQIISAYLGRVKTVLPGIRSRLLRDALGSRKVETPQNNRLTPSIPKKQETGFRSSSKVNSKDIDWRRTSDLDILDGRAATKRR